MNNSIHRFVLENRINELEQKLEIYETAPNVLQGLNEYITFHTIVMECREIRKCKYNKHDLMRIKRKVDHLRRDPEIKHAVAIHNELINKKIELETLENIMFNEVYQFLLIKQI